MQHCSRAGQACSQAHGISRTSPTTAGHHPPPSTPLLASPPARAAWLSRAWRTPAALPGCKTAMQPYYGYPNLNPLSTDQVTDHLLKIRDATEKRSREKLLRLRDTLTTLFRQTGTELKRAFKDFDANGDGTIDRHELRTGLAKLATGTAVDASTAQLLREDGRWVDDLFDTLDRDGDGQIDYSEFATWFGVGPPPPPALPQARAMQAAQSAATVGAGAEDRNVFLMDIAAAARKRVPAPPPTPEIVARSAATNTALPDLHPPCSRMICPIVQGAGSGCVSDASGSPGGDPAHCGGQG
jgi:hypothetical protein